MPEPRAPGAPLLRVTQADVLHALDAVVTYDAEKIESLFRHLRAMPATDGVLMGPMPGHPEVIEISGRVPKRPAGWFCVRIVLGPLDHQMVGGLILGQKRPGHESEESEWRPLEWDLIPLALHRWAG